MTPTQKPPAGEAYKTNAGRGQFEAAGEEIRTPDVQLGKLALDPACVTNAPTWNASRLNWHSPPPPQRRLVSLGAAAFSAILSPSLQGDDSRHSGATTTARGCRRRSRAKRSCHCALTRQALHGARSDAVLAANRGELERSQLLRVEFSSAPAAVRGSADSWAASSTVAERSTLDDRAGSLLPQRQCTHGASAADASMGRGERACGQHERGSRAVRPCSIPASSSARPCRSSFSRGRGSDAAVPWSGKRSYVKRSGDDGAASTVDGYAAGRSHYHVGGCDQQGGKSWSTIGRRSASSGLGAGFAESRGNCDLAPRQSTAGPTGPDRCLSSRNPSRSVALCSTFAQNHLAWNLPTNPPRPQSPSPNRAVHTSPSLRPAVSDTTRRALLGQLIQPVGQTRSHSSGEGRRDIKALVGESTPTHGSHSRSPGLAENGSGSTGALRSQSHADVPTGIVGGCGVRGTARINTVCNVGRSKGRSALLVPRGVAAPGWSCPCETNDNVAMDCKVKDVGNSIDGQTTPYEDSSALSKCPQAVSAQVPGGNPAAGPFNTGQREANGRNGESLVAGTGPLTSSPRHTVSHAERRPPFLGGGAFQRTLRRCPFRRGDFFAAAAWRYDTHDIRRQPSACL